MIEEKGRVAVWAHAAETGMQDTIRRITTIFPIEDIAIISPGKLTYLDKRPVKHNRLRPFDSTSYLDPVTGEIHQQDVPKYPVGLEIPTTKSRINYE